MATSDFELLERFNPQLLAEMDRALLDPTGRVRLLKADAIRSLGPHDVLRAWCGLRGRYLIPTVELRRWLEDRLCDWFPGHTWATERDDQERIIDKVLEIGAGMGDLGGNLHIRMTDSGVQQSPEMQVLYRLIGQQVTKPPPDVLKLEAIAAAKEYKPHTILAAWVTQKYQHGDTEARVGSCVAGVDEQHLLNLCKRYVFIGNERVHGDKRILREPHQTHAFPWIVSRGADQSLNRIWIWER